MKTSDQTSPAKIELTGFPSDKLELCSVRPGVPGVSGCLDGERERKLPTHKVGPKTSYQIDPREAVPEVSKSKGYINQEKMCL